MYPCFFQIKLLASPAHSLISFLIFWYKENEVGKRRSGLFLRPREARAVDAAVGSPNHDNQQRGYHGCAYLSSIPSFIPHQTNDDQGG